MIPKHELRQHLGCWVGECVDVMLSNGSTIFGLVESTPARLKDHWVLLDQAGNTLLVPQTAVMFMSRNGDQEDDHIANYRVPKT